MQTPRTVLTWATLDEWLACARKIDRRRASRLRNRQAELHARALPVSFVDQCASRAALVSCDRLLRRGPTHFCQPPRGQRQNATHTALIVAIANRIAHIDHADDHASMTLGHNSRNAGSVIPQGAAPSPIPSAGPGGGHSEEEGRKGFVTGFSGRETSRARPSQESPAMTRKSAARRDSQPADANQPEPQPAPVTSKVRNIALGLLVLSPTNVRKTPSTPAEDAELEASIRAKGILQNLIVHPAPVDRKDIYEVDAGGRRLKVLQKLTPGFLLRLGLSPQAKLLDLKILVGCCGCGERALAGVSIKWRQRGT